MAKKKAQQLPVLQLNVSALATFRDKCVKAKKKQVARYVEEAIRLTNRGHFRAAIDYLRSRSVPITGDCYAVAPARVYAMLKQKSKAPAVQQTLRPSICARCKQTFAAGEFINHSCFPPEKPVRVKKRSSLPGKRGYVKVKSHFKYKLSDESGGWY